MRDWAALLADAAAMYDAPGSRLAPAARIAARNGFRGGARWMNLALAEHRGHPATPGRSEAIAAARIGWVKYGVSALVALVPVVAALATGVWPLAALAVPAFYAVEAQWVFAFPLALDGAPRPLRTARTFTRRAGGTLAVMRVVMPIAASMVFGGLAGRGFVRSWCLGCLAIVLWYEAELARGHSCSA